MLSCSVVVRVSMLVAGVGVDGVRFVRVWGGTARVGGLGVCNATCDMRHAGRCAGCIVWWRGGGVYMLMGLSVRVVCRGVLRDVYIPGLGLQGTRDSHWPLNRVINTNSTVGGEGGDIFW